MNPEFKHSELLVETIIGTSTDVALGMIYNNLNGYDNNINFEQGDIIIPEGLKVYQHELDENEKPKVVYKSVLEAEVIEIDLAKEDKLKVKYLYFDSKMEQRESTAWINHRKCDKINNQIVH